jgi:hypothetical protein
MTDEIRTALPGMEIVEHRDLDAKAARAITDRIRSAMGDLMAEVVKAYIGRVWVALGYQSWADYIKGEFNHAPLWLPRDERKAVVELLRGQGMSTRAIGPAVGVDQATVVRDLSGDANASPDVDGDALAEELITADEELITEAPPGGVTEHTPGQTDRVSDALDRARNKAEPAPVIGRDGKHYPPKPKQGKDLAKHAADQLAGSNAAYWEYKLGESVSQLEFDAEEARHHAMAIPITDAPLTQQHRDLLIKAAKDLAFAAKYVVMYLDEAGRLVGDVGERVGGEPAS